jgi:membrane protein YdbS with pleckstrin-like domain
MRPPPCRSAPTEKFRGAIVPNDVKAALSVIVLIVAGVLAFWGGSPIRHDFSLLVVIVAVLMVGAMWVFPEAASSKTKG